MKIWKKVVSKEFFMLRYCLNRHKTQEMCDKAVDACVSPLKFAPTWFVTNKMLKKYDNVIFSNDDIDIDDIDSDIVTFFSGGMGYVTAGLNNFELNDNKFGKDDTANIVLVILNA